MRNVASFSFHLVQTNFSHVKRHVWNTWEISGPLHPRILLLNRLPSSIFSSFLLTYHSQQSNPTILLTGLSFLPWWISCSCSCSRSFFCPFSSLFPPFPPPQPRPTLVSDTTITAIFFFFLFSSPSLFFPPSLCAFGQMFQYKLFPEQACRFPSSLLLAVVGTWQHQVMGMNLLLEWVLFAIVLQTFIESNPYQRGIFLHGKMMRKNLHFSVYGNLTNDRTQTRSGVLTGSVGFIHNSGI